MRAASAPLLRGGRLGRGGVGAEVRAGLTTATVALIGSAMFAVIALTVPGARRVDSELLQSFLLLQRPGSTPLEYHFIHTVNPSRFLIASVVVLATCAVRRRPDLGVAAALALGAAPVAAEALKSVLPPHVATANDAWFGIATAFPSGHATAAMALTLSLVLCTRGWLRVIVAAAGIAYVSAVAGSLLIQANHYPSDVIVGFVLATVGGLLAATLLRAWTPRARRLSTAQLGALAAWSIAVAAGGIVAHSLLAADAGAPGPFLAAVLALVLTAAGGICAVAALAPETARVSADDTG